MKVPGLENSSAVPISGPFRQGVLAISLKRSERGSHPGAFSVRHTITKQPLRPQPRFQDNEGAECPYGDEENSTEEPFGEATGTIAANETRLREEVRKP